MKEGESLSLTVWLADMDKLFKIPEPVLALRKDPMYRDWLNDAAKTASKKPSQELFKDYLVGIPRLMLWKSAAYGLGTGISFLNRLQMWGLFLTVCTYRLMMGYPYLPIAKISALHTITERDGIVRELRLRDLNGTLGVTLQVTEVDIPARRP